MRGFKRWHNHVSIVMVAGLHYQISLWQVLKDFGQMFSAVQRCGHLVGITAGKLKKDVSADSHDRRAHLRRVLIEELIGGNYTDTELAGFREKGIEATIKCNQVLNFIAVERKELTPVSCKERVLDLGQ